jgi:hypothetical protein
LRLVRSSVDIISSCGCGKLHHPPADLSVIV